MWDTNKKKSKSHVALVTDGENEKTVHEYYHAYYELAQAIAHTTTVFSTEKYAPPSSPMLGVWRWRTPRRGADAHAPTEHSYRFKKHLIERTNKEILNIPSADKWVYTKDVLLELASGAPLVIRQQKGSPQARLEERFKRDARERLREPWHHFTQSIPPAIVEHQEEFLKQIDLHEFFAAPYLHVLCPDRIIKREYEERDDNMKFVDSTVILPLRHQLHMIAYVKEYRAIWSAKYLPIQYKIYSLDNTVHLGSDFVVRYLRRRYAGLDLSRHGITMDNIDEYTTFTFIFKDAPAIIPLIQDMAGALADYAQIDYDKIHKGMRYAAKKLHVRTAHSVNESDLEAAIGSSPSITIDDLIPKDLNLPSDPKVDAFLHMLNTMKDLSRQKRVLMDGVLTGWNIDGISLDENIVKRPEHIANPKEALLVRDEHGFPVLETRLCMRYPMTFGLAHAAHSLGHEIRKDVMPFMHELTHFLPFTEEALTTAKGYISRVVGMFTTKDAYNELHGIEFDHRRSVLPPKKIGAFVYDHRFAIGSLALMRCLKGAWDHRKGEGRFEALFGKIGDAFRTKEYLRFIIDILTYRPEEAHAKLYGPIETDQNAIADAAIDFVAHSRLTRMYDRRMAKRLYRQLGNEIQTNDDNIKVRFATAYLLLVTGKTEEADEHLQDVCAWLYHKKSDQFDGANKEELYFLQHQMLPAAQYYHAQALHKSQTNEHGLRDLVRDAYNNYCLREEPYMAKTTLGDRMERRVRTIHIDYPEKLFEQPLELVQSLIMSPLNFSYREQMIAYLYEKNFDKDGDIAVRRALNDLSILDGMLSASDQRAAQRIYSIADQHRIRVPSVFLPGGASQSIITDPVAARRYLSSGAR